MEPIKGLLRMKRGSKHISVQEIYKIILDTKTSRTIRLEYLQYLKENTSPHLINLIESERGFNGGYYSNNLDVWNAYEYAPWEFTAPLTLIIGDLNFIDDEYKKINLANVEICGDAKVLVTGDINAGSIFMRQGELQCLGTITVKHNLVVSSSSYMYAQEIKAQNYGGFGITNCHNINALYFVESEMEGLKLRKSNRDIVKIKQDN